METSLAVLFCLMIGWLLIQALRILLAVSAVVLVVSLFTGPPADAATVRAYFVCQSQAAAEQVIADYSDQLIPGLTSLPEQCKWIHTLGMPWQGATVLQLLNHYEFGGRIIWSAKVRMYDGQILYTAGEIDLLTS